MQGVLGLWHNLSGLQLTRCTWGKVGYLGYSWVPGGVCCVGPTGLDEKGNVEHRWDCQHPIVVKSSTFISDIDT